MASDGGDDLERLIQATLRINGTEDLESMCRHILEGAREVLRSEAASLMLVDERSGNLEWFSVLGEAGDMLVNHGLARGEGIAGWVAATGESVLTHDAAADPRFCGRIDALSGFTTRSLLCVPLVAGGRVLGVLELLNHPDDAPYDEHDMRKAQAFASLSAMALEHRRVVQVAEEVGNVREIGRFKNEMMTVVAQELRNPLTTLRGFAELLDEDADVETLRQFGRTVRGEAERAVLIVEGFMEVARVEAGQTTVREDAVSLPELLDAARQRWAPRTERHDIRVLGPDDERARVVGDAEGLRQVLDQLVRNAIQYSPEGGPVTLRGARQGAAWRISVTDRGIGIPDDGRARLFHHFYRIPSPHAPAGAGLGLTLAKALVERMSGRLGVESDPKLGTTFWFSVPAVE